MPIAVLTPEQRAAALRALSDDLSFLFTDRGVTEDHKAAISHVGVQNLRVFARINSSEAGVRAWIRDDVKLEPGDGPNARSGGKPTADAN